MNISTPSTKRKFRKKNPLVKREKKTLLSISRTYLRLIKPSLSESIKYILTYKQSVVIRPSEFGVRGAFFTKTEI